MSSGEPRPGSFVRGDDGEAVADPPESPADLARLATALRSAGDERVRIEQDGFADVGRAHDFWYFEEWGLSPSPALAHPFAERHVEGYLGCYDAPTDRLVVLFSIGHHYFEWTDTGNERELGRFESAGAAAEESTYCTSRGHGSAVIDRGDDTAGVIDILIEHGIDPDSVEPEDIRDFVSMGLPLLEAIAGSETVERVLDFEHAVFEFIHDVTAEEIELLDRVEPALPVGEEGLATSIRCARSDARLRRLSLEEALCSRGKGFLGFADLRRDYDAAIVEVNDGTRIRPAMEVAAKAGPLLVLTAANPLGIELDPKENTRRNARLEAELTDPMVAVGRSVDGTWVEDGFAVPFTERGLHVAMSYGQLAVFRVEWHGVSVVQLLGVPSDSLRRSM